MEYQHKPIDETHPHQIRVEVNTNFAIYQVGDLYDKLTCVYKIAVNSTVEWDMCVSAVAAMCGSVYLANKYRDFFDSLEGERAVAIRGCEPKYPQNPQTPYKIYSIGFMRKPDAMLFKLTYGGN